MRYEIIHIQGNSVEDVTQRMSAIINTYVESGWNVEFSPLIIVINSEGKFSCVKEMIHK